MINKDIGMTPYVVNLGRPNFFGDDDFTYWSTVFNLIEHGPIDIAVNGFYHTAVDYCKNKQGYGGGGMKFMFWFRSEDDRDEFMEEFNKL